MTGVVILQRGTEAKAHPVPSMSSTAVWGLRGWRVLTVEAPVGFDSPATRGTRGIFFRGRSGTAASTAGPSGDGGGL